MANQSVRLNAFILSILFVFTLLAARVSSQASQPPNIIVMLIDDLGIGNVGFAAKANSRPNDSLGRPNNLNVHTYKGLWYERDGNLTGNIDALANEGIIMTKHYAYSTCTGSRHSFLSGRLPVHVGLELGDVESWDGGLDREHGYDALPVNMTTIAAMLQKQGYTTHMTGKMDGLGMGSNRHTPRERGFNSSLGFFHHANDAYDYTVGPFSIGKPGHCSSQPFSSSHPLFNSFDKRIQDFWFNEYNDSTVGNSARNAGRYYNCSSAWLAANSAQKASIYTYDSYALNQTGPCTFEDITFTDRAIDVVRLHSDKGALANKPFFLYYSAHIPHTPLQAPPKYLEFMNNTCGPNATGIYNNTCNLIERRQYLAMIKLLDDEVGRLVTALKAARQNGGSVYDNTIILFMADNGAAEGAWGGGNAYPHRGGKGSDFNGGFITPAFASGGFTTARVLARNLPKPVYYDQPVHISDHYTTLCSLASPAGTICTGVGADPIGDAIGLHPVEGVNLVPFVDATFPKTRSPHPHLHLSANALLTTINGTQYKLVTGASGFDNPSRYPMYPNCTYNFIFPPEGDQKGAVFNLWCNKTICCPDVVVGSVPPVRPTSPSPLGVAPTVFQCGQGCLFDIENDPLEKVDLCETHPELCNTAIRNLIRHNASVYENFPGCVNQGVTCPIFTQKYNDTYGPFVDFTQNRIAPTSVPGWIKASNECNCLPLAPLVAGAPYCAGNPLCLWNSSLTQPPYCVYNKTASNHHTLTIPQIMALDKFYTFTKGPDYYTIVPAN